MKTIRKKISSGFIAVSFVLFCAVVLNVFELKRMSLKTEEFINLSNQSAENATRMLNALQKQNIAVLNMLMKGDSIPSVEFKMGSMELSSVILETKGVSPNNVAIDSIESALEKYHKTIDHHVFDGNETDGQSWFMNTYIKDYYALDGAIKAYMTSSKGSVSMRISELEDNVYKTITPSVLTLLIAVTILLMFFFFIDTYYTKPVRRISKALDSTLKTRAPYQVKIDDQSEISQLNDNITELVNHIKKQQ